METVNEQKKPVIITGSGTSRIPKQKSAAGSTAAGSKQSQPAGSIESANTSSDQQTIKPLSLSETLSLLQTDLFDLKGFGCKVTIVAEGGRLAILIRHESHKIDFDTAGGHILLDGIEAVK